MDRSSDVLYGTAAVPEGAAVFTVDGHALGTVKAVTGTAIKIDAHFRRDYWLPRAVIIAATPARVTLGLVRSDVSANRLSGADEDGVPEDDHEQLEHLNPDHRPILLDEDEQQAQRLRMERELAEQRGRRQGPLEGA